ncbi:MAG: hypothetical protein IJK87_01010, partial [Prevotella sp.]|nr:hypothetical protein [Prevotella sp.]
TISEKKMAVMWLRFLTEINDGTRRVSEDLLQNAEVKRAIEIVEESAFSDAELYAYDKFWDIIRVERTREYDREQKYKQMYVDDLEKATEKGWTEGMEKGMAKGLEKGIEKGIEKGMGQANHNNARKMKALGATPEFITQVTGLSAEEIDTL